ncbi:hypothetical protein LY76DRAFT_593108 [Colletotrichum caudatum]|nr:hypothetical protein LY76DRAFT_593108 [Colletotrichum caudatum]
MHSLTHSIQLLLLHFIQGPPTRMRRRYSTYLADLNLFTDLRKPQARCIVWKIPRGLVGEKQAEEDRGAGK